MITQFPFKTCKQCGAAKPCELFHMDRGCLRAICRACIAANSKQWRDAHPDKVKAKSAAYRMKHQSELIRKTTEWVKRNPEKASRNKRRWAALHPEKVVGRFAKWATENPEKMEAARMAWKAAHPNYGKQWAAANPNKINAYSHQRRAKYVGRYTDRDIADIRDRQRGKCGTCKANLKRTGFHVDHIIPIKLGGPNWPDNIQLLCPTCNLSKGSKDPFQWANENGRLF
ncbi:MAG: HNH endonuclease signature motif containing protein [bacterium]